MKRMLIVLVCLVFISAICVYASEVSIPAYHANAKYLFNGQEMTPPDNEEGFIYQDRIYVPLRFMAESLQKNVDWDDETDSVIIHDDLLVDTTDGKLYAINECNHNFYAFSLIHADIEKKGGKSLDVDSIVGQYDHYLICSAGFTSIDNEQYIGYYRYDINSRTCDSICDVLPVKGATCFGMHENLFFIRDIRDDADLSKIVLYDVESLQVVGEFTNTDDMYITSVIISDKLYYLMFSKNDNESYLYAYDSKTDTVSLLQKIDNLSVLEAATDEQDVRNGDILYCWRLEPTNGSSKLLYVVTKDGVKQIEK